jgi:hypothetical protein
MKNFKDLFSEVAQPKAPEEKRFMDQHTIEVIPHPVAPDHVFSGEIPGITDGKRLADKVNDEADYDKAYKKKVVQTLPNRGTGDGKDIDDVKEEKDIVKKSITEILGVNAANKKKDDKKDDDEEMEEAMEATCGCGPDCGHCGGKHESSEIGKTCSCCGNKIEAIKEGGCSDSLNAEKKPVKKATTKEDKVDAKDNKDSLEPEAKLIKNPKPSPTQVTIKDSNGKTLSMTFKEMLSKVSTEEELLESPQQEIPMMMKQLHFISYAVEEMGDYLRIVGQDPEEWWQNKLAEVFSNVKSLYAYAKGDQMVNSKPLSAAKMYNAGMSYESIEAGSFELQSKTVIEISEEDATILNKMFSELTETNTKEMYSVLVADEAGYNEILEFAKENV